MSKLFIRCMGKTACQEDETKCRTCGRSLEEIYETRALIDGLVSFVQKMGYENCDAFFDYISVKATKKTSYIKQQTAIELEAEHYDYH